MGTDIHSISQIKFKDGWRTMRASIAGDERNYDTFAILADIRNGSGFAGVETGEAWPVISQPRGLPDDVEVNDEIYVECPVCSVEGQKTFWLGEHSHSWVTLEEMKAMVAQLDAKVWYKEKGVVTVDQFLNWKRTGEPPSSWCGATSGPGVVVVDEKDFSPNRKDITHVKMTWQRRWRDCAFSFTQIIEELESTKKAWSVQSDEDVRLVFGFDS